MLIQILDKNGENFALQGVKLIPFHSLGIANNARPNFISNFSNDYSDLSKEVYNVSVFVTLFKDVSRYGRLTHNDFC